MLFWQQVKQEMTKSKITLKVLSERTELNYQTLQNQIKRNIEPTATNAYKIATVLGVSVEFLVTGNKELLSQIQLELKEKTEELKNIKATLKELL